MSSIAAEEINVDTFKGAVLSESDVIFTKKNDKEGFFPSAYMI